MFPEHSILPIVRYILHHNEFVSKTHTLIQSPIILFPLSVSAAVAAAEPGGWSEGRDTYPTKFRMSKHWQQELTPECEGQPESP